jgi:hypothetical protein
MLQKTTLPVLLAAVILLVLNACKDTKEPPQEFIGEEYELPVDSTEIDFYGLGKQQIKYVIFDSMAIIDGDIILHDFRESSGYGILGTVRLGRPWSNKTIPYTFSKSFGKSQQEIVEKAIEHWQLKTEIRFVKRTNETNYVIFAPGSSPTIGSSAVGMKGRAQYIYLGSATGLKIAIHEIGHAVGLFHEQSRPDRDTYVRIIWDNIKRKHQHNFSIKGTATGPYDFKSRMHYDRNAFAKNKNKPTIVPVDPNNKIENDGWLSNGDVAAVKYLYDNQVQNQRESTFESTPNASGLVDTRPRSAVYPMLCEPVAESGLCRAKADFIFNAMKKHPPFDWGDSKNNCEDRANAVSMILGAWKIPNGKAWIFNGRGVDRSLNGTLNGYGYHVACAILVRTNGKLDTLVIDPLINWSQLLKINDWADSVAYTPVNPYFLTLGDRYIFGQIGKTPKWIDRNNNNFEYTMQGLTRFNGGSRWQSVRTSPHLLKLKDTKAAFESMRANRPKDLETIVCN